MALSKSKFVAGMQCLKRLYLQVHEPGLAGEQSDAANAVLSQGKEVGIFAQRRFPNGVCVISDHTETAQALEHTRQLVANADIPAIFEAAFRLDDVVVRVDILERLSGDAWRMIEVKSGTDLKEHYLYDVAIQKYVVAGTGVSLAQSCLMHLNRNYVYDGGRYDFDQLFTIRDLTEETNQIGRKVMEIIGNQKTILAQAEPPQVAPGPQCCYPFTCEFYAHCNKPVPPDHVSLLPGIRSAKVADLLQQGCASVYGIPDDYPLTDRERQACECIKAGVPWFSDGLREELNGLQYPVFFMDFETVFDAIPRFAGMRPYDQLTFQWSVQVQEELNAEAKHFDFLAKDHSDPRPAFIESLCEALGKEGHIVVYNQTFESGRLAELAAWVPGFAAPIAQLQRRMWDLYPFIRSHVYHPAFGGSYSLKSVLPALVPEMRYEGMAVADGTDAGQAWKRIIQGSTDVAEIARLTEALLAYCRQDTSGMVKILDRLRQA